MTEQVSSPDCPGSVTLLPAVRLTTPNLSGRCGHGMTQALPPLPIPAFVRKSMVAVQGVVVDQRTGRETFTQAVWIGFL